MKMITDVEGEGLESLLGKRVTLYCGVCTYTGDLVGVNANRVKLSNASIVYEKREVGGKADNLVYASTQSIESFDIFK